MTRRSWVGIAFATIVGVAGVGATGAVFAAADYSDQKVVYHNDGQLYENPKYFRKLLRNVKNNIAAVGDGHIEVRVVDHGDGIVMLQLANADNELAGQIDALRAQGVRFLVCKNTLSERKIDWHTLYGVKEGDLVPSGVAELVKLQQAGFVYVHP